MLLYNINEEKVLERVAFGEGKSSTVSSNPFERGWGGVNIQMLSKLLCEKRTKLEVGILRLAPTWKMTNDDVQS